MRRVVTQARTRGAPKNDTFCCHQSPFLVDNTSSRFCESSAYRWMNASRVSSSGRGGAPTSILSMFINQKFSLTHW
jgi:hypothetical protein